MILLALDPWWTDFYTVGGFVFGVLGLGVGIGGFWIAIRQIQHTRRAAEAAAEAAKVTLAESKEGYERFVAAHAGRMLSELQAAVLGADWKVASLRSRDLAEILATLPTTGNPTTDGIITELVTG